MHDFSLHLKTKLFFGSSQESHFFNHIASRCDHVLLLLGQGSIEKAGIAGHVERALDAAQVKFTKFLGIEPNPLAETITEATRASRASGVRGVLALGGGSVMDAAKAVAALLFNGEDDIWPYVLGEPKHGKLSGAVPLFCIPTTAATASEVTPYSVISSRTHSGKSVLAEEYFKPEASWLNPAFTVSVGRRTTQDGAADIMSHVFENYVLGDDASPIADHVTEGILKTVMECLPVALANPKDLNARGALLWASTVALSGIQLVGRRPSTFPLHSIEHSMSAVNHDLAHGRGLATLFPSYFRWLIAKDRGTTRFERLGSRLFGVSGALAFVDAFEGWLKSNELLQDAAACGVSESDYDRVASYAIRTYGGGEPLDVLGPMTRDDIVAILKNTHRQGK